MRGLVICCYIIASYMEDDYMENSIENADMINRIRLMELYFDTVKAAYGIDASLLREEGPVSEMLAVLIGYYESEQWIEDYSADEAGLLPDSLKRGILSQDGFYDFLGEISD